ncbi:MAG: hypothetical protein C5B50_03130 [Verrucomicrobia bacterium]|nr:MAG: hypothetical protein C5B50_03130 [Verrucomicrobiota bacterium]
MGGADETHQDRSAEFYFGAMEGAGIVAPKWNLALRSGRNGIRRSVRAHKMEFGAPFVAPKWSSALRSRRNGIRRSFEESA